MSAKPVHIQVLGASGSGKTTLGRALAEDLRCPHIDSDEFFWLPTVPPFQTVRPSEERLRLLREALEASASWVLSGGLCGWSDTFIPRFDLVVFVWIPQELRMHRLHQREIARYGPAALEPGGSRHEDYKSFMAWAAGYDDGDITTQSRRMHETWLGQLSCPVLRLEKDMTTPQQLAAVRVALQGEPGASAPKP